MTEPRAVAVPAISVLLIDDSPLARRLARNALGSLPGCTVIAEGAPRETGPASASTAPSSSFQFHTVKHHPVEPRQHRGSTLPVRQQRHGRAP